MPKERLPMSPKTRQTMDLIDALKGGRIGDELTDKELNRICVYPASREMRATAISKQPSGESAMITASSGSASVVLISFDASTHPRLSERRKLTVDPFPDAARKRALDWRLSTSQS